MKFYKIINKEEIHHGLQYKDGLINDPKPFKPFGNCEPGGIYFSSNDILAFVDYGCWIREVTIPEDAKVYQNLGTPEKWKADRVFLHPRKKLWTVETIKKLIEEGANVKANDSIALRKAAYKGHTDIVKLFIPLSNVKAGNSESLRGAVYNGHTDIVKLLIPYSDVNAIGSEALIWAIRKGHADIIKLLIPHSDVKVVEQLKKKGRI